MKIKGALIIIVFIYFMIIYSLTLVISQKTIVTDSFAAVNNTQCMNNYTINSVKLLMNISSSDSLSKAILNLDKEYNELFGFIEDRDMYKDCLLNNYNPVYREVFSAVKEWKKVNNNLTYQQKKDLESNLSELKKEYDLCYSESLKEYGNSRLVFYKSIINAYRKQLIVISENNVNIQDLNNILDEANKSIIILLEKSLSNANSSIEVINAINKYCLNDGCTNGINHHLDTKYTLSNLEMALKIIKNDSDVPQEKINELEISIKNAKKTLNESSNKKYSEKQRKIIWDNIKNSNKVIIEIKNIIKNTDENKDKIW
jgi:hypothetical protein